MRRSTAGESQGNRKVGRPLGMVPTVGIMACPSSPTEARATQMPTKTTASSFISQSIFTATHPIGFGNGPAPLIRSTAIRFNLTKRLRAMTEMVPSTTPGRLTVWMFLAISTAVLKKPTTWGSLMPHTFFSCPCMISIEPPETKPLMRLSERKRTAKAALQRPMSMRKAPLMKASREASWVRSSMSRKYASWSANRIATMAPEDMEACREVPSIA
mmetsp:Transcript_27696/g.75087  ORF Transcript_27696/g.75087 Transcript_27696/m.75087 type:complete len:215 (-) Transcript_27696:498-1142(-)